MKPILFFLHNGYTFITPPQLHKKVHIEGSYRYLEYLQPPKWPKHTKMLSEIIPNPNVIKVTTLAPAQLYNVVQGNTRLIPNTIKDLLHEFYNIRNISLKDLCVQSIAQDTTRNNIDHIFLFINMWSIRLIHIEPTIIGDHTTFAINEYKIELPDFKTVLAKHLRKLYSTLTQNITLKELKTLLYNLDRFIPLRTTSPLIADIVRAQITLALNQLSNRFQIKKPRAGRLFISGEIVYLLGGFNNIILSVADPLLISGVWEIVIDKDFNAFASILTNLERSQTIEYGPSPRMIYILTSKPQTIKLTFKDGTTHQLLVVPNDIHVHRINVDLTSIKLGDSLSAPTLAADIPQRTKIIVDSRKRPILYGPTPADNQRAKLLTAKLNTS